MRREKTLLLSSVYQVYVVLSPNPDVDRFMIYSSPVSSRKSAIVTDFIATAVVAALDKIICCSARLRFFPSRLRTRLGGLCVRNYCGFVFSSGFFCSVLGAKLKFSLEADRSLICMVCMI